MTGAHDDGLDGLEERDDYRDWIVERTLERMEQMHASQRDALRVTLDLHGVGDAPPSDAEATGRAKVADRGTRAAPEIRPVASTSPRPEARPTAATPLPEDVTGEIDAADLLALELPPMRYVVPGIIAEGTTILAGPPKMGKSVLAYQLAVECSLGGELLGVPVNADPSDVMDDPNGEGFHVKAGAVGRPASVLYVALEDGRLRGQKRLRAVLKGRKLPHGRLRIRWEAPPMGGGFETFLQEWLDGHDDAVLVIVDTLGRIRGEQAGDTRRNAYQVDVRDLGTLQRLVMDRPGVALVIVHHTNKGADDDFVARVSGTYGIAGSVDTLLSLSRKRSEAAGTLRITGRDIPERDLPVRMDDLTGWTLAPDALPGASAEQRAVYDLVRESAEPVSATPIARELGMDRSSVQHMLRRMEENGLVLRNGKGYVAVDRIMSMGKPMPETVH